VVFLLKPSHLPRLLNDSVIQKPPSATLIDLIVSLSGISLDDKVTPFGVAQSAQRHQRTAAPKMGRRSR
jgi:hypothetical protein